MLAVMVSAPLSANRLIRIGTVGEFQGLGGFFGTEISSSNIFFCGTRCALIHGRVKAPSGQNQLRAKSVHRLTDTVPVQAVPVGKEQRQPSQLGVCPWGNLIIGGNAGPGADELWSLPSAQCRRLRSEGMAFSTTRYRMLFKVLEISASAVFLFLCAKAFCSHFYNDLKRLVQKRRSKKLRPSTT